MFAGAIAAFETWSIYLGEKLGYYDILAARGALTADELADAAGAAPRYVREWLEQQVVAGLLDCDDATLPAESRRYRLGAAGREVGGVPLRGGNRSVALSGSLPG